MRKLEIGYNHPFEVRRETCRVVSGLRPDIVRCTDAFTVLFLSDLHLNKFSRETTSEIIHTVQELDPTIILFGGDYVDSKQGLGYFNELLESVSHRSHVFAIAGNHDHFHGTEELKTIAERNNVAWIDHQSTKFQIGETTVRIDTGRSAKKITDNEFSILVLHNPKEIERIEQKYDLAFAGHLHGSQFVFWQKENALYPGKLFYKWNILKTTLNGNPYFISKGLGDTLPLRYNCKRDMIFVEVTPKLK
jgi:predicted MPP superfamily phosphohydrolase